MEVLQDGNHRLPESLRSLRSGIPDGSYAAGGAMGGNPIAGVNESGYSKERHKEMMAIFDVTYSPLKDWNIKGNIATYSREYDYQKPCKYILLIRRRRQYRKKRKTGYLL